MHEGREYHERGCASILGARRVTGQHAFSALIVRLDNSIVARIPLTAAFE
jgi:hypothetical protein